MPEMTARYPRREQRERSKDVALGATVGATGLGLSMAGNNLSMAQMRRVQAAGRSAPPLTYGARSFPRAGRSLARLGAMRGANPKEMLAAGILGLTAGALRRRMREAQDKQVVAKRADIVKADTKPPKAGIGASEYKSQFVYGLPVHQARQLNPNQRSEALARTMGVWSAPLAPKGERARTTVSQGAALGAAGAVGLGAGALAAGAARKPTAALKALRNAGKAKPPKGLADTNPQIYANAKPSPKKRLADVARSADPRVKAKQARTALRDPQRRADLARGAVTAAVTTPVAGVLSAAAANRTVNRSPESRKRWRAQDKKVLNMVTKNQPTLAEVAKRSRKERADRAEAKAMMAAGGAAVAAPAAGYAYDMRGDRRAQASSSDWLARRRGNDASSYRRMARRRADSAARLATEGLNEPQGVMRQLNNKRIVNDLTEAQTLRADARNAALKSRGHRADQVKALRSARNWGKGALGAGAGAIGLTGYAVHQAHQSKQLRRVRKSMDLAAIVKAIEPDVDPGGFLEQVRRERDPLRDSRGRFAGRSTDTYGAAVIAVPYEEGDAVDA